MKEKEKICFKKLIKKLKTQKSFKLISYCEETGIKTYFPTQKSNLYLPSFVSPPEVYPTNPVNLSQSYQYQPIYYNSVNIYTQSSNPNHNNCISYQTSGRTSHNNNNNSNFCGFCLSPSSIASNAQNSQEIASLSLQPQQEFLPQVITGNCKQFEPELISSRFTELGSNDSFKQQPLITHFKNEKKREIYVRGSNKIQTENMVSTNF